MKKLNTLILDDNPFVGENILQRIIALDIQSNERKLLKPRIDIEYLDGRKEKYFYFNTSSTFLNNLVSKLSNIDYLLLDVYYQDINFVETDKPNSKDVIINVDVENSMDINWNLNDGKLSEDAKKFLQNNASQSTDLLNKLEKSVINKLKKGLKGVIIYTYSPNPDPNKLAERTKSIVDTLGVNENIVEIFSSHRELFQSTDFELYKTKRISPNLVSIGLKGDYGLYGSMIGEIIYHKIVDKEFQNQRINFKEQKHKFWNRLFLFYLMFASIGFGGNALFDLFHSDKGFNSLSILIISILTGVIIPIIVLSLKPEILISHNKVNK